MSTPSTKDPPKPQDIQELPLVVPVPDQPCQRLYEGNPVLLGFDVVQYHFIPSYRDGGVAVRGRPEFAYNFEGYQFWFSTIENRNLFINDPWKYVPAWGGFCSWGIALELPPRWPWQANWLGPPASPWEGWFIVDGVLMFNIWASYTDKFLQDRDENVQKAIVRWKEIFHSDTIQVGPFNTHCIGHGPLQNWCLARQPSPWLEPLPEPCSFDIINQTIYDTNNCQMQFNNPNAIASAECLTSIGQTLGGGGTVSDHEEFDDFNNSSISPHAIRIIKILCSVGFVLLLFCAIGCCHFISYKKKQQQRRRQQEQNQNDNIKQQQQQQQTSNDFPLPHDKHSTDPGDSSEQTESVIVGNENEGYGSA